MRDLLPLNEGALQFVMSMTALSMAMARSLGKNA